MANVFLSSVAWTAVTQWASGTAYVIGDIRRQVNSPTEGNERVFRCTTAGTSGASQPTWILTVGATTADGATLVWTEITGQAIYNGNGGGTAWAAPHYRLSTAMATGWFAAGDTLFVASNHAEANTGVITYTFPGTPASPNRLISVDETVVPVTNLTTPKAGASITLNGTTDSNLIASGVAYVYGVTYIQTTTGNRNILIGTTTATGYSATFDTCTLDAQNTGTTSGGILFNSASTNQRGGFIRMLSCVFKFAKVNHSIYLGVGDVYFRGCSLQAASANPTNLFTFQNAAPVSAKIFACDFSVCTGALFAIGNTSGEVLMSNCKIAAAMTSGTFSQKGLTIKIQNCDSGATNYKDYLAEYAGTITQELTTVMTGGASDGTTPLSWAMVSSANSKIELALMSDEFCIWNEGTGASKSAVVEFCGAAALTNADFWIDVEYLGSASTPQSTIISSRVATILTAGTNYATSTKTWGGGPASKQYAIVSFTPQLKGWIKCRARLAKASTTVYVNPVMEII